MGEQHLRALAYIRHRPARFRLPVRRRPDSHALIRLASVAPPVTAFSASAASSNVMFSASLARLSAEPVLPAAATVTIPSSSTTGPTRSLPRRQTVQRGPYALGTLLTDWLAVHCGITGTVGRYVAMAWGAELGRLCHGAVLGAARRVRGCAGWGGAGP
jgi:hypothetical protein